MRKLLKLLVETKDAATEQLPLLIINTFEISIHLSLHAIPQQRA